MLNAGDLTALWSEQFLSPEAEAFSIRLGDSHQTSYENELQLKGHSAENRPPHPVGRGGDG